jgi:HPt (histidine-containing phosphotransfer) domain-containing protein
MHPPAVNDPASVLRAVLRQLRLEYLQSLPARLERIAGLSDALEQPLQADAARPELERCAHAIAGTAGTFGFAALGAAARALELEAEAGLGPALRARVDALRHELEALVAGAPAEAQA